MGRFVEGRAICAVEVVPPTCEVLRCGDKAAAGPADPALAKPIVVKVLWGYLDNVAEALGEGCKVSVGVCRV